MELVKRRVGGLEGYLSMRFPGDSNYSQSEKRSCDLVYGLLQLKIEFKGNGICDC